MLRFSLQNPYLDSYWPNTIMCLMTSMSWWAVQASKDSTHLTPMILKLMIKQGNKFGTLKKPMLSLFDLIIFDK